MGIGAAVFGFIAAPERTWLNLLLNGFYVMSLALSATFFLALQRLAGARWSVDLRRIPEAFMLILPVAAVLMLAVFLGGRGLYPWSHPDTFAEEAATGGKGTYLDVTFLAVRAAIAFSLWALFGWLFRRTSLAQDREPGRNLVHHDRLNGYAAAFVVVFAPTFTLSAYDWIVSLEPYWFSTMFGVYVFAGAFVQGIAAITLAVVLLKERGYLGEVASEHHLHDLGKLLFAFSTFWAYIWICQYLLIWYGDLPEEVPYYVTRTQGPWLYIFGANLLVNWLLPFFILMRVRAKRTLRTLKIVSVLLLFGHWMDLYLLIMPSKWGSPQMGLLEPGIAAGCLALAFILFLRQLAKAPLVPVNDPVLVAQESSESHAHP